MTPKSFAFTFIRLMSLSLIFIIICQTPTIVKALGYLLGVYSSGGSWSEVFCETYLIIFSGYLVIAACSAILWQNSERISAYCVPANANKSGKIKQQEAQWCELFFVMFGVYLVATALAMIASLLVLLLMQSTGSDFFISSFAAYIVNILCGFLLIFGRKKLRKFILGTTKRLL
jgi:hypothetical protein